MEKRERNKNRRGKKRMNGEKIWAWMEKKYGHGWRKCFSNNDSFFWEIFRVSGDRKNNFRDLSCLKVFRRKFKK